MSKGLTAYEPTTGEIVWNAFTQDLPDRCVSSPIVAGDMVLDLLRRRATTASI